MSLTVDDGHNGQGNVSVNVSLDDDQCRLGRPDYRLALLSVSLLILAVLATVFNLLFLSLLRKTAVFHPNVRTMLANAELGTILAAGCLCLRSSLYHGSLLAMGYQQLAIRSPFCALLESLYNVGTSAWILSMVGIGLERLCASRRSMSRSTSASRTDLNAAYCAGASLTAGAVTGTKRRRTFPTLRRQRSADLHSETASTCVKCYTYTTWLIGGSNAAILYCSARSNDKALCYCHMALVATKNVIYGCLGCWLSVTASTLLCYALVLGRNRRRLLAFTINTARHNLQERFLAWHNVTLTAMLLPAVVSNAALSAAFFAALMPVYGWYNDDDQSDISVLILVAIVHILAADMLLHPILTVKMCEKLRSVACKQYPRLNWLWGSKRAIGAKFSTTSMRGISIAKAPSDVGVSVADANCSTAVETKEMPTRQKHSDSRVIVDYRINPDQHRQLVEHLWSMKE